ncbi:urea amidolyase [Rhodobacterales bacterium HKCCE3408]|nr:urea amidolyase [Rhodobacterales bacterium HKCCE3408]
MSLTLMIRRAGPGLTVQDQGRTGTLAFGLSRGGAADRLALYEGAALLGQSADLAALEMAGTGGTFVATGAVRIALTGAPMHAAIDGRPVAWNACHALPDGAELTIGAAKQGVYGYLHLAGGIAADPVLGARGTHLAAGIGAALKAGDALPLGPDAGGETGLSLPADDRFEGGTLRVLRGPQTGLFAQEELDRLEATTFTRDARGNRMGVRLAHEGAGFSSEAGLSVLSDIVVPGDVQIGGDGAPMILLAECQTTGGYPRIGTVLPADMPRAAQTPPGGKLRLRFIDREEALTAERSAAEARASLAARRTRLVRDPAEMRDLLSYDLISGVSDGSDPET